MKDIAIYGAGGFGREVACLINIINNSGSEPQWNIIGFFDDDTKLKGKKVSHFGYCFGGAEELSAWETPLSIVISVGSSIAVMAIVEKIHSPNIDFPNLIHPDFKIADPETFHIGKGNVIQNGCSVSCDVSFGDFNVFNGSVVFGHDDKIGNYNIFMPAIRVSGNVIIGNCNFFGVGSIILQKIKIGNNIRLGAGSVLMTKPKVDCLYIGNPAKIFKY